jgi:sigma-54 dependent transcriptional regulator, acetoin dehydrogenase operon transcriptional activator AcoR
MLAVLPESRRIQSTWHSFVENGHEGALSEVRPIVRDSWIRCRRAGLDPGIRRAPIVLSRDGLAEARSGRLFETAAPVARLLSEVVHGQKAIVALADAQGRVLEIYGEEKDSSEVEAVNAVPGSRWTESDTGTDAHPCSLYLDAPVQIYWFENYLEVLHDWTGAAAPIHDPLTTRQLGTLALYGCGELAHPRALDLVVKFASLVEGRLQTESERSRLLLLEHFERCRQQHSQADALCVGPDGTVLFATADVLARIRSCLNVNAKSVRLPIPNLGGGSSNEQVCVPLEGGLEIPLSPVYYARELAGFVALIPNRHTNSSPRGGNDAWRAAYTFNDIVGKNEKLIRCVAQARRFALTDQPVLLLGESGTGKELFAHAIHNSSDRRLGPFVALNCGALNEELLTAELFGYADGAFTGAARGGRTGKIGLADGGTIFLDEVDALSHKMQMTLLRALEEKRVLPVGCDKPRAVNFRLICATSADLQAKLHDGTLRADFYYRIGSLILNLPSLRERRSDIPLLVSHLLSALGTSVELDPEITARLTAYCWPGNIRQLKNVLEQLVLDLGAQPVSEADIPTTVCPADCSCPLASDRTEPEDRITGLSPLEEAERQAIVDILRECQSNVSRAASRIGVSRVTLYKKIRKYNISVGRARLKPAARDRTSPPDIRHQHN